MPRQAILVIHGMGEQLPMSMLRPFVRAAVPPAPRAGDDAGVTYFSMPDRISGSFELRRFIIPSPRDKAVDRPQTDLYEYYWAHEMTGNRLRHVGPLIRTFLWRWPWTVPPTLILLWLLLWAVLIAAGGLVLHFGLSVVTDPEAVGEAVGLQAWQTAAIVGLLYVLQELAAGTFGDVARYVNPRPENVAIRQTIRAEAVTRLRRLHDSGQYDRIIVVGHSLGSFIGLDAIQYLWADTNFRLRGGDQPAQPALEAFDRAAGALLDAAKDAAAPAAPDIAAARTAFRAAQRSLFVEQIKWGSPWRISDFISVGSPLTYAAIFLARNRADLLRQQADGDLPCCPPVPERNVGAYTAAYRDKRKAPFRADGFRGRILHHAAAFAPTRWTNIWYPARLGVFGDGFAGRLAPAFGPGVVDRPVRAGTWRRFLPVIPHTGYFRWLPTGADVDPNEAIGLLRAAMALDDGDLVRAAFAAAAPKVNLNTADVVDLQRLTGIGPVAAAAIVARRRTHPFSAVADLSAVEGIGPVALKRIARQGLATVAPADAPDWSGAAERAGQGADR